MRRLVPVTWFLLAWVRPPEGMELIQSIYAWRLWRSSRHYRRACRVLRRAGRKVRP